MTGDRALETLREAVRLSPENIPLRRHLAESLLAQGRPELAEAEFREALTLAPEDAHLKVGLANAFLQQGKNNLAVVILEALAKQPGCPAPGVCALRPIACRRRRSRGGRAAIPPGRERRPGRRRPRVRRAAGDQLGRRRRRPTSTPETSEVVEGRVRSAWSEPAQGSTIEVDRPSLTFTDVGGMESVKEEIRIKIIHPMNHPELYRAYGKSIGGGILLYGPPGCGKTYLARATAGEIHAGFLAVGINDVLEMWIGNSERNLHALFEQARQNTPCVLFFDEVDALAASRADLRASGGRQLINQFLAELDGIGSRNEGVLILAATNAPWHLDRGVSSPRPFRPHSLRPASRPAGACVHLAALVPGKPVQNVDYEHLAKKTDHFSGADLKAVVDLAIEAKLREAMKAGVPRPLTTKDLLTAAAAVKPSTREWFATARNYALYSNQGGIYDDILKHLKLG